MKNDWKKEKQWKKVLLSRRKRFCAARFELRMWIFYACGRRM
jgi:hypothetical protein